MKLVIYGIKLYKYKPFLELSNMATMDKQDLLKLIGKRVQEIRVSKGYSQVDLVGKIEGSIDTTNISRIESGRTNPTAFTLSRIADALEIELKELFDFTEVE
jgi:ribosome-binding protein aMBF1 (putative translation factor)